MQSKESWPEPSQNNKKVPLTESPGGTTPVLSPRPRNSEATAIFALESQVANEPRCKARRISNSVVNSPSVTPPPNISTAASGALQNKSISRILEPWTDLVTSATSSNTGSESGGSKGSRTLPSENRTSDIVEGLAAINIGEKATGTSSVEELEAHDIPAIHRRASAITIGQKIIVAPPEVVPPQLTMTSASSTGASHDEFAASYSLKIPYVEATQTSTTSSESVEERSSAALASIATPSAGTSSKSPRTQQSSDPVDVSATVSASLSELPKSIATPDSWSKRKPLSPEGTILHPLSTEKLPVPKENEALFLPGDAERISYTGFLQPWESFNQDAIKYWKSAHCRDAFDEIKSYPIFPVLATDTDITDESHGSEVLHCYFEHEVLKVMQKVYNMLMETQTMKNDSQPNKVWLGDPDEEDLSNNEVKWDPSFVLKASRNAEDEATRLLGQVEYLGGREGALTWAVDEMSYHTWGSLRCVLGEIAQYMLKSSTKYAFIVAADEIMCLRFELVQKVSYDYLKEDGEPRNLFIEPWIHFSSPIKFADLLHEDKNTVSTRLALLYLIHCSMQKDFELPAEMGNAAKYKVYTKPGQKCLPKLSWDPYKYVSRRSIRSTILEPVDG